MWRSNEPVEEDASDLDPPSKRRRSRRRAWRDGLADQTVVKTFEDIRSYRAFERTLIGSIDPRSAIELTLVHRLASLLWRLRRASAIETGLFEIEDELLLACRKDPSRGPDQVGTIATATRPNGHGKIPRLNDGRRIIRPMATSGCQRLCARRSDHGPRPAPWPNASCAFPTLTLPCLTVWVAMKRDYGGKRRKRFGSWK